MRTMIMTMALMLSVNVMAQDVAESFEKAKVQVKEKASKEARSEAKRLKKEGWSVSPGALPMERQLQEAYEYQLARDNKRNKLYYMGEGKSVGESYDAARLQAVEVARQELAGQVGSEATRLVEVLTANKQLPQKQAASISTTISEAKSLYSQKIGKVEIIMEASRELKNGNTEVLIRMAASANSINELSKSAVREELEKNGIKMSEELKAKMANY